MRPGPTSPPAGSTHCGGAVGQRSVPPSASWRQSALWRLVLLAVAGLLGMVGLAVLGLLTTTVPPSFAVAQDLPSRQGTLFGVLATPGSNTIDPQLKSIAPQLRKRL